MSCHLLHGIFTEHVAKDLLGGLMWAAAALELCMYSIFSGIEFFTRAVEPGTSRWVGIPWMRYILVAVAIAMGRGLTWVAYGATTYPTVLLFKSSKIIVVMASAMVILRKGFSPAEYSAAMLAVTGLYLFSRGNKLGTVESGDGQDTTGGIAVLFCAVAAEALVSTLQEVCLRRLNRPLAELMFVTNSLGALLLVAVSFRHGDAHELHERLSKSWDLVLWVVATVSLAYGGTYAFTSCIMGFGAVVATGLGIIRKLLSVLLSFILFPKPVAMAHVLGLLAFFSGLFVAWSAEGEKARQKARQASSGDLSDEEKSESKGTGKKVRTSPRLAQMRGIEHSRAKEGEVVKGSRGDDIKGRALQGGSDGLPSGPQA